MENVNKKWLAIFLVATVIAGSLGFSLGLVYLSHTKDFSVIKDTTEIGQVDTTLQNHEEASDIAVAPDDQLTQSDNSPISQSQTANKEQLALPADAALTKIAIDVPATAWHFVQGGAYTSRVNAEKVRDSLLEYGITPGVMTRNSERFNVMIFVSNMKSQSDHMIQQLAHTKVNMYTRTQTIKPIAFHIFVPEFGLTDASYMLGERMVGFLLEMAQVSYRLADEKGTYPDLQDNVLQLQRLANNIKVQMDMLHGYEENNAQQLKIWQEHLVEIDKLLLDKPSAELGWKLQHHLMELIEQL
ncbi:hypothetical protein BHU72_12555 [Desulfuribacillus stibiiarsenatis]|uniref:SPOR domain-containing protein n=1 Tax=Desulfuribacillus stibiiarsenatis TaxID=1390249 RepID=A0A1E5L250_9FIRM|nr:hypothetical protein [Desulfuribacillus stibiiarsenatis]OEH84228.1 hypothetical protein BHU72_12555 [Desulfuribacillus stibiiarsenatis]